VIYEQRNVHKKYKNNICRINATATFLYCGISSYSEINKCSGVIYHAIKKFIAVRFITHKKEEVK